MDWLKNILDNLPLDDLSDMLGEIVIWWSQLVKGVPPEDLPMYAYIGGTVIVLILWLLVARMLPRPFGGMSWVMLFAILLAPGTALGDPTVLAPASISVVYALMMKDTAAALSNALPILVVLVAGLFIGFIWQLIRGAFESSLSKARSRAADDAQATLQLASANHATSHATNHTGEDRIPQELETHDLAAKEQATKAKTAKDRTAQKLTDRPDAANLEHPADSSAPPRADQRVTHVSQDATPSKSPVNRNPTAPASTTTAPNPPSKDISNDSK